jgi:hypothetical protein
MRGNRSLKSLGQDETLRDEDDVEYYSDSDESESTTDSMGPEEKSKNFEFTNNLSVMRLVRMVLCLEALGIVIDTPSFYVPTLFKIACRPILYYSIRFYSYPIIDIAYIIQYYLTLLKAFIDREIVDRAKGGVEVHLSRRLMRNS